MIMVGAVVENFIVDVISSVLYLAGQTISSGASGGRAKEEAHIYILPNTINLDISM